MVVFNLWDALILLAIPVLIVIGYGFAATDYNRETIKLERSITRRDIKIESLKT